MAAQRFGGGGINARALQLCHILTGMAQARQTTTFGELADQLGMNPAFPLPVAQFLDPIAAHCDAHGLPPLTALVLQAGDGIPGGLLRWLHGQPWEQAVEDVFNFDWDGFCLAAPDGRIL